MKAWAYLLGVLMALGALVPQLVEAVSFRRCAVAAPAQLKGRAGDGWIYAYTSRGRESRVALRSVGDSPGQTIDIYFCPQKPDEVSSRPPAEDVRRALSFLAVGLAIFPIITGLYFPWAYRRNWLRALLARTRREKKEGSLREPLS